MNYLICLSLFLLSCEKQNEIKQNKISTTSIVILGTIQDAGAPQIACEKSCCRGLYNLPDAKRKVVSLGVIDPENKKKWIFEATPDFPSQLRHISNRSSFKSSDIPDGIFLTHAHIGHYTGLMYLGREALGANNVPVYTMPKMKSYLETNGPWNQLISLNNISLKPLKSNKKEVLTNNITVIPFSVPHRDEYSETVGYKIIGKKKSALFIPDINKWNIWKTSIINEVKNVDYAFLDATFFDGNEINNRPVSEIPHPFIIESMELFKHLSTAEKAKIYFIHFNHTNPAINIESVQSQEILKSGFNIAQFNQTFEL